MLRNSGFTLVELMIVVAIVALLVVIALPNYQTSVRKTRRADAQKELIAFAGAAERLYSTEGSYITVDDDGGIKPANTDFYTYSFPVAATAKTWTIRATPTAIQNADACKTMTLTHTGQRTTTGSDAGCWQ